LPQTTEKPPMARVGLERAIVGQPLQLHRGDAQIGVAKMEEAEFEPRLVAAIGAELGRNVENQRPCAARELPRGEVAPSALKPAQDDDFDAERRLAGKTR